MIRCSILVILFTVEELTAEQYANVRYGAFPGQFKLEMNIGVAVNQEDIDISSTESYLLHIYETLYMKMKKRLKVDIPVIDFNYIRLRRCISKVVTQRSQQQTMLVIDEMAMALEFYLQIDGMFDFSEYS